MTTVLPSGTVSVSSPSVYPSKLNGLLALPGIPATSLNVAVLVVGFHLRKVESSAGRHAGRGLRLGEDRQGENRT